MKRRGFLGLIAGLPLVAKALPALKTGPVGIIGPKGQQGPIGPAPPKPVQLPPANKVYCGLLFADWARTPPEQRQIVGASFDGRGIRLGKVSFPVFYPDDAPSWPLYVVGWEVYDSLGALLTSGDLTPNPVMPGNSIMLDLSTLVLRL